MSTLDYFKRMPKSLKSYSLSESQKQTEVWKVIPSTAPGTGGDGKLSIPAANNHVLVYHAFHVFKVFHIH